MAARVAVVVLHWRALAATQACLASVRALAGEPVRLHVVDNEGDFPAADAAGAVLHRPGRNLGYTGGNNLAIRAALAEGADYVWLLNNDTTVAPGVLAPLVAAAEADDRIGLASPLIRRTAEGPMPGPVSPGPVSPGPASPGSVAAGKVEFAGGLLDLAAARYRTTTDPAEGQAWQAQHPQQFVLPGTALLLRRALVARIGLLDERFFAYWEDIDYARRALAAGFRTRLVAEVAVCHAGRPRLERPHYRYLMARNELLFWRKHLGARALRPLLWTLRRERARAACAPSGAVADAILLGLWDGLRGRGGVAAAARRLPPLLRPLLGVAAKA